MSNEVQKFNNPEFGDVRIVMKEGTAWFVAADVCRVLELADVSSAVRKLDEDEKGTHNLPTLGGEQAMLIVNEPGLYRLIFTSRKPEAKNFQRWVYHDVLPTIRKTGSYSLKTQSVLLKAASEIDPLSEILQSTFALKRGIALSQAIDLVGNNYKLNFDSLKKLLPLAEHETGYLNATSLAPKIGVRSPKFVNVKLASLGLQYKDGHSWRLTERGKAYGEEMPYTRNGHSGYQIRRNSSVVAFVNENSRNDF